jgi:hypothetical protein
MKAFTTLSAVLVGGLTVYCGSYLVLRCAGMEFRASRHEAPGGNAVIHTYVSLGTGHESLGRLLKVVYFPMLRAEHAWLLGRGGIVVYE